VCGIRPSQTAGPEASGCTVRTKVSQPHTTCQALGRPGLLRSPAHVVPERAVRQSRGPFEGFRLIVGVPIQDPCRHGEVPWAGCLAVRLDSADYAILNPPPTALGIGSPYTNSPEPRRGGPDVFLHPRIVDVWHWGRQSLKRATRATSTEIASQHESLGSSPPQRDKKSGKAERRQMISLEAAISLGIPHTSPFLQRGEKR
jgi:hypothetical protein